MLKSTIFSRITLAAIFFSFFSIFDVTYAGQKVYLAIEPLPIMVAEIKARGITSKKAILKALTDELTLITPEIAQKILGIQWKESELDIPYPILAICYIGPEVGYGLFAMEDIPEGEYIAEYTGTYLKTPEKGSYYAAAISIDKIEKEIKVDPFFLHHPKVNWDKVTSGVIDAEHIGNAARFAEHFPTSDEIQKYKYETITSDKSPTQIHIATSNSKFGILHWLHKNKSKQCNGLLESMLIATRNIKAFEQIGVNYSQSYGSEFSSWPDEPHIFDNNGNVIPRDTYRAKYVSIMLYDVIDSGDNPSASKMNRIFKPRIDYISQLDDQLKDKRSYIGHKIGSNLYLVEIKPIKEKLSQTKSRITTPAYRLKSNTDYNLFLDTLEIISEYNLTPQERSNILRSVRDNKIDRSGVEKLLTEKTKVEKKDIKAIAASALTSAHVDSILYIEALKIVDEYKLDKVTRENLLTIARDSTDDPETTRRVITEYLAELPKTEEKKETKAVAVTALVSASSSSASSGSASSTNSTSAGGAPPPPPADSNKLTKSGADNTRKQATDIPSDFSEEKGKSTDLLAVITGTIRASSNLKFSDNDDIFTTYSNIEQQVRDILRGRYSPEDAKNKILELKTIIESENLNTQEREALIVLIHTLEQMYFSHEQIMQNKINEIFGYDNDDINYHSPYHKVSDIHEPCTTNRLYQNNKIFEEMMAQDKELFDRDILKIHGPHFSLTGGTASAGLSY